LFRIASMKTAVDQGNNQRGRRSRQEILDAAARVMAARGYVGTSLSALVEATGLPKSAIYHHFGSKAGLLSEVMARGAHAFFDAMRQTHASLAPEGPPRQLLGWYLQKTGEVFVHHEDFLRLLSEVMARGAHAFFDAMRQTHACAQRGARLYAPHDLFVLQKRRCWCGSHAGR